MTTDEEIQQLVRKCRQAGPAKTRDLVVMLLDSLSADDRDVVLNVLKAFAAVSAPIECEALEVVERAEEALEHQPSGRRVLLEPARVDLRVRLPGSPNVVLLHVRREAVTIRSRG